jgi:hypothetical protein
MNAATVRLLGAAGLFVAWLGWLTVLAVTTSRPIVLSRPQLLVSSLDVIAQVDRGPDRPATVTVLEVVWPPAGPGQQLVDTPISVTNLADSQGWVGPDRYILPLIPGEGQTYKVAPLPRSPGIEGSALTPRVYPLTPETRRQLETILTQKAGLDFAE